MPLTIDTKPADSTPPDAAAINRYQRDDNAEYRNRCLLSAPRRLMRDRT